MPRHGGRPPALAHHLLRHRRRDLLQQHGPARGQEDAHSAGDLTQSPGESGICPIGCPLVALSGPDVLSSGHSRPTGLTRARGSVIQSFSLSLFPLQGVAKAAQAKIVLSTDWRRHPQLKTQLIHALRSMDMDVIGATPCRPNWQALPHAAGLIFTTTTLASAALRLPRPRHNDRLHPPPYAHPHLVPPHLLHSTHPSGGRRCGRRRSRRGCRRAHASARG